MRTLTVTTLPLALLTCLGSAQAATLAVEQSGSSRTQNDSGESGYTRFSAVGLSSEGRLYGELYTGQWAGQPGSGDNKLWAVSGGWRSEGSRFLQASMGLASVDRAADTEGSTEQALFSLGMGVAIEETVLSASYRHLAKGHKVAQEKEDFFTVGFGISF